MIQKLGWAVLAAYLVASAILLPFTIVTAKQVLAMKDEACEARLSIARLSETMERGQ
jgi:hypothetical protein